MICLQGVWSRPQRQRRRRGVQMRILIRPGRVYNLLVISLLLLVVLAHRHYQMRLCSSSSDIFLSGKASTMLLHPRRQIQRPHLHAPLADLILQILHPQHIVHDPLKRIKDPLSDKRHHLALSTVRCLANPYLVDRSRRVTQLSSRSRRHCRLITIAHMMRPCLRRWRRCVWR